MDLRYGFNPTVDNSMADPDGDGLPNLAEFVLAPILMFLTTRWTFPAWQTEHRSAGLPQLPNFWVKPSFQTFPIILYVNGLPAQIHFFHKARMDSGWWNWDTTFLTTATIRFNFGLQIIRQHCQLRLPIFLVRKKRCSQPPAYFWSPDKPV